MATVAEADSSNDSFDPSTLIPQQSFSSRMRAGSIPLTDTSGWSNMDSSDSSSPADSIVDCGEATAELRDVKVVPWAMVDSEGKVITADLARQRPVPSAPIDLSSGPHAQLDRIMQTPLVANPHHRPSLGYGPPPAQYASPQHVYHPPMPPHVQGFATPDRTPELVASSGFSSADCSPNFSPTARFGHPSDGWAYPPTPPNKPRGWHNKIKGPFSPESLHSVSSPTWTSSPPVTGGRRPRPNQEYLQHPRGPPPPIALQKVYEHGGGKAPPGALRSFKTNAHDGQRRCGRCKAYSCDAGIGFIVDDNLKEVPFDIKFHWTDLLSEKKFASVAKGEILWYTLHRTSEGFSASYVTGPDGRPVLGQDAETVRDSRRRSRELFASQKLPTKRYQSKWRLTPTPESSPVAPSTFAESGHYDEKMNLGDSSILGLRISMNPHTSPVVTSSPWPMASDHPPAIPPRPVPQPSYHHHQTVEVEPPYYPVTFPEGSAYPVTYAPPPPPMPAYPPAPYSDHSPTAAVQAAPPMLQEMSDILAQREALLKQQLAMTAMLRHAQARASLTDTPARLSAAAPSFQPGLGIDNGKVSGVVRLGTTIQAPPIGHETEVPPSTPASPTSEPGHRMQSASIPARRVVSSGDGPHPKSSPHAKRVSFADTKRRAMSLSSAAMNEASPRARVHVGVANAECAMRRLQEAGAPRRMSVANGKTPWAVASANEQ